MIRKKIPHIAVDLDGTLAFYDRWLGIEHIGDPIPEMVDRVQRALGRGWKVSIFTSRVAGSDSEMAARFINGWCFKHLGLLLDVTATKHGWFDEFWDDKAVGCHMNNGVLRAMNGTLWEELLVG